VEEMEALEECLACTFNRVQVSTETACMSQPPQRFWKASRWVIYCLI